MKKILLLLFFFAATSSYAQNLSFEETITYFNTYLSENPGVFFKRTSVNMMKAKKDGTVSFGWKNTDNNTEKIHGSFNLKSVKTYKYKNYANGTHWLELYNQSEEEIASIYVDSKQQAEKLEKVLKHLATLCTEKDPFDN